MADTTALIAAAQPTKALQAFDQARVRRVIDLAERALADQAMQLPDDDRFAADLTAIRTAFDHDQAGADPAAITDFLILFAERRSLPLPAPLALEMDAAVMAAWPADLFAKAARAVWERFAEMRLPNPPDFRCFIAEDLADRAAQAAALHTLERRLNTRAQTRARC